MKRTVTLFFSILAVMAMAVSCAKEDTTTSISLPKLVDLGLSVKWADCNLGASKPEEYGGFYQWAGTKDVTDRNIYLDESNCPYHTGSDNITGWTKYVPSGKSSSWSGSGSPDNKTVLDPKDDVAHVKLGGKWRMPTFEEWDELEKNCASEQTTLNGVQGWKFTSKKPGYTDKWIFLPAAGYRLYNEVFGAVSGGYYWSASLYSDNPDCAFIFMFYLGNGGTYIANRCNGQSVRPVSE